MTGWDKPLIAKDTGDVAEERQGGVLVSHPNNKR